jgi:regulator of sigma E protease
MFQLDSVRNLVIFVFIVGGLIFLHELGHFLASIRLGVKIKEFGLGFPPRLLGAARDTQGRRRWFFGRAPADLDPSSVIYSLNWLPIGGFVRPAGEDDPAIDNGLAASPKLTRLIVLAAGPAMNLLVGVIVFTLVHATGFPQSTDHIRITAVAQDSPALAAGLKPGDVILSANGEALTFSSRRITEIAHQNAGQPVRLTVERAGQTLTLSVVPRASPPAGQGPIGISLEADSKLVAEPLPQAVLSGLGDVGAGVREIVMLPVRLAESQVQLSDVRPISIVGMAQINNVVVQNAVEVQSFYPILMFTGMITVALALTNLLPLPALDGGRILFVLIEAVRGRRIDPIREGYVHIAGMLVLLTLMVALVINDIYNPIISR